ncbi:hypothetical protein ACEPAG_9004 [Sanghuangporus baumii]
MLWKSIASTALLLSAFAPLGLAANPSCTCPPESGKSTQRAGVPTATGSHSQTSPATNQTESSGGGSISSRPSSGPQFFIYSDKWMSNVLPPLEQVKGYTVFALAFLMSTGPEDQAKGWAQLDKETRQQLKKNYNDAGIKVIVSAFGGSDAPTSYNKDPAELGNIMAQWVIDHDLDGIDVDYEDFNAMDLRNGRAEKWVITFTKALRSKLPQGKYIVTHAPVAPWFSKTYTSGAYRAVHKEVGDMIDWYNIQFYNQFEYENCETLMFKSTNKYPETSLEEIARSGIPQHKLIVGKPATVADASNGFIDSEDLATCIQQVKDKGWSGGVMVWQYPNADARWISTVRSKSWPVGS